MLQNIRDKTQGWITRVIIGLVCAAFILWGVHNFVVSSGPAAGFLARVNGQDISVADFNATYQRLVQERAAQLGANFELTPVLENQLKAIALEQLITTTALAQAAEKKHFRFTPKQVGDIIGGISAFQENGHFSPVKFAEVITNMGFSETGFFDSIRQAMLINQIRVGMTGSSFALPWEIDQANLLVNQKRDFAYVEISPDTFATAVRIDDAAVKAYYDQHQNQFTIPPTVVVQYLVLSLPEIAKKLSASESDLQKFYQDNTDRYTTPAKWQLTTIGMTATDRQAQTKLIKITAALKQGQSVLEALAPYPQAEHHDSNWLSTKEMSDEIAKAVTPLKTGEVSEPILIGKTWVIIKVNNQQVAKTQDFKAVKAKVQQDYLQEKASHLFADNLDQLNNLTYTNPQSLEPAAKALGLVVQTSEILTPDKEVHGFFANPAVKKTVFSKEVLAGTNSAPITLDDTHVMVIRAIKSQPSQVKSLEQVKVQIRNILQQQKEQELASTQAQDIVNQVIAGKSLSAIIAKTSLHLTLKQVAGMTRHAAVTDPINLAAFQLALPFNHPSVGLFHLPSGKIVVIQVVKATNAPASEAQNPVQQRVMNQQIENAYAQMEYQIYVNGVLAASRINVPQNSTNAHE